MNWTRQCEKEVRLVSKTLQIVDVDRVSSSLIPARSTVTLNDGSEWLSVQKNLGSHNDSTKELVSRSPHFLVFRSAHKRVRHHGML
jgi:hypothetical protein